MYAFAPPAAPPVARLRQLIATFVSEVKVALAFSGVVGAVAAAAAVAAHAAGVSVVSGFSFVEASAAHVAVVGLVPAFVGAWLFCAARRVAFRSAPKALAVASVAASVGVGVHELLLRSNYYLHDSALALFAGDVGVGGELVDTSGAYPVYAVVVFGAGAAAAALHRWAARR